MALPSLSRMAYFYPRPPRGGRPDVPAVCPSIFTISIHALREEGDSCGAYHQSVRHYFYPRPPRGGRRRPIPGIADIIKFLSTPSARRATMVRSYAPFSSQDFYPRPPRGGRPLVILRKAVDDGISIHALREEGDQGSICNLTRAGQISIHALREEGDRSKICRSMP